MICVRVAWRLMLFSSRLSALDSRARASDKFQAFNSVGAPLAGGKLYSYVAGTTTPKATYTTQTGGTANSKPHRKTWNALYAEALQEVGAQRH